MLDLLCSVASFPRRNVNADVLAIASVAARTLDPDLRLCVRLTCTRTPGLRGQRGAGVGLIGPRMECEDVLGLGGPPASGLHAYTPIILGRPNYVVCSREVTRILSIIRKSLLSFGFPCTREGSSCVRPEHSTRDNVQLCQANEGRNLRTESYLYYNTITVILSGNTWCFTAKRRCRVSALSSSAAIK